MNEKEKLEEALLKVLTEKEKIIDKKDLSEREDDVREFFNAIDFTPLFDKIKGFVGDNSIEFTTPELTDKSYGRYHIEFNTTEDIKNKCGIMGCVFETVQIGSFNGAIGVVDDTDELYLWLTVDFKFQYISGGSNGAEILKAVYKKSSGWEYSV